MLDKNLGSHGSADSYDAAADGASDLAAIHLGPLDGNLPIEDISGGVSFDAGHGLVDAAAALEAIGP